MELLKIIEMVNSISAGLSTIGINFGQLVALQQNAADEGRELTLEDFAQLRTNARTHLDALDAAISNAEMEENYGGPEVVGSANPPTEEPEEGES